MKMQAPKAVTWYFALLLGVLGLLGAVGVVSVLAPWSFWLALFGLVILALGSVINGL